MLFAEKQRDLYPFCHISGCVLLLWRAARQSFDPIGRCDYLDRVCVHDGIRDIRRPSRVVGFYRA